jgi:hypothetical protein
MRVRHRWLLLSIFVAAVVIVVAVLQGKRTAGSGVTVSFIGYTNLPNKSVRSAVFVFRSEHPSSVRILRMWSEVEGVQRHKGDAIDADDRLFSVRRSEGEYSEAFSADEPPESGRWRASCYAYELSLGVRLLIYTSRHGLIPESWVGAIGKLLEPPGSIHCVTCSSPWLTNSFTGRQPD